MKVGVPVVPGTPGPVASYLDGDAFIKEHGFPGWLHTSINIYNQC
jgi:pyruvate carboxylase